MLAQTAPYLPAGIHLAVVDPGVGTDRRPVVVAAGDRVFVGPDNGLLLAAVDAVGGMDAAYVVDNPRLCRHPVSRTFHGRDVFAPAAAHLAGGVRPGTVGPAIDPSTLIRLPIAECRREGDVLVVEVFTVDGFGNVQLAAGPDELVAAPGATLVLETARGRFALPYGATFADVPPGAAVLLVDSAARLAIAVNGGSACSRFALNAGDRVRLAPARGPR